MSSPSPLIGGGAGEFVEVAWRLACLVAMLAPEHLAPSSKTLESHPVAVPPCGTLRRWQSLTINSPQPANQGDRGPRSTKHVHIRPNQMESRQEAPKLGEVWLVTSIPDEGKTAPGPTSDNIVART